MDCYSELPMVSTHFNKKLFFSQSILVLFLSLFLSGMAKAPPLVGGPAPQFELETVEGRTIKLSDLKGEFVVLNFWATWCVACIKEMPEFQKAYQSSGDNKIKIIGVNFSESKKKVEKFIQDNNLSFPLLLDGFGNTAENYEVRSLPVTYFISPDGIIRGKIVGGGLTKEIIEAKINQMNDPAESGNKKTFAPASEYLSQMKKGRDNNEREK